MQKIIDLLIMTIIFFLILLVATDADAEDKFLSYQFNENVVIRISNVACPINQLKQNFPFAVVASRKDGQHLFGCFTHKGDDIVIQWSDKDISIFPANYFLQGKD